MPHFYETLPEDVRRLSHHDAVERYRAGAGVPASAISGLVREQLLAFPVPGTWSIQQIVVHLMDTDLICSYRMKRIVAEPDPALDAYDENAFVPRLRYQDLDAGKACDVFRLNREVTADVLARLPAGDFERTARHPEVGPMTLGQLLRLYIHHLDHHLAFIRRKRQILLRPACGPGTAPA